MSGNEFWEQDITKVNGNKNWFSSLSPQRKVLFGLVLLFVLVWGFFIGFNVAFAKVPPADEWHIANADDLNEYETELAKIEGLHTILIVGSDTREGYETGRTDTIMLAFINGDKEVISLLSIPRDTYVQIAGTSTKTKINHAYAYGGVSLTKSTIEQFLGITIDDYVLVDFEGFVGLVDALDGVEINVDQRMINYDEKINLNPGLQTLNGEQALGYCRFRIGQDGTQTISDIKRAEHQQNFIIALKNKLLSASTLWKVPQLVTLANQYLESSISTTEALSLGRGLMNMDLSNIQTYTIPTYSMWIGNGSYEIVSRQATLDILDQIIGDEYTYTPNIIDDGGAGRYSAPSDAEEDDAIPDLDPNDITDPSIIDPGTPDPGTTDPGTVDPGTTDPGTSNPQPGDPGYVEPIPEDPGVGGGQTNDIPEPE